MLVGEFLSRTEQERKQMETQTKNREPMFLIGAKQKTQSPKQQKAQLKE